MEDDEEDILGDYIDHEDCIEQGTHLTKVDDDGFCEFCGYQD